MDLICVIKKYRYYSKTSPVEERKNLLEQDLKTTSINQKQCTDITYIHTLKDVFMRIPVSTPFTPF